jgi:hypothetical protein
MMCFADAMLPAAFLATGGVPGQSPAATLVIAQRREKPIAPKCGEEMLQRRLIQPWAGRVAALHQGGAVRYGYSLNHPRIERAVPA